MVDEIFPVDEIPAAKRRKKWAEVHAHLECPIPFSGFIIPYDIQAKTLSIISESGRRVSEASLENTRKNRQDHEWESKAQDKRRHHHRFHRAESEQKNLINRTVDKIEKS